MKLHVLRIFAGSLFAAAGGAVSKCAFMPFDLPQWCVIFVRIVLVILMITLNSLGMSVFISCLNSMSAFTVTTLNFAAVYVANTFVGAVLFGEQVLTVPWFVGAAVISLGVLIVCLDPSSAHGYSTPSFSTPHSLSEPEGVASDVLGKVAVVSESQRRKTKSSSSSSIEG